MSDFLEKGGLPPAAQGLPVATCLDMPVSETCMRKPIAPTAFQYVMQRWVTRAVFVISTSNTDQFSKFISLT